MSQDMTEIRSSIREYAGHADAAARWRSDQQVRAWVGESLVALRERLPADTMTPPFEDLLLHCQFGDQHVLKALEDDRFANPEHAARVESEDRRVVAAATRSMGIDSAGVPAFIAELASTFRERDNAIVALGASAAR